MADHTHIQWTDATWNPTTGCDRVSSGCDHCYALTMAGRLKTMGNPKYQTDGPPGTSGPGFGLAVHPDVLGLPLSWKTPRRIFVNSMSDLFHDKVPDEFIARVFAVMGLAPQHIFQLLTKRHGRMRSLLNDPVFRNLVQTCTATYLVDRQHQPTLGPAPTGDGWLLHSGRWPLPNVHLGVSVEDQPSADLRIPALLDTPAAVRWISAEPLLGPVDLHRWLPDFGAQYDDGSGEPVCQAHGMSRCQQGCASIDWVVVGGESGPDARPMALAWARNIVKQCQDATVPVFVKQLGSAWAADWAIGGRTVRALGDPKGADPHHWPSNLKIRQYPVPRHA